MTHRRAARSDRESARPRGEEKTSRHMLGRAGQRLDERSYAGRSHREDKGNHSGLRISDSFWKRSSHSGSLLPPVRLHSRTAEEPARLRSTWIWSFRMLAGELLN